MSTCVNRAWCQRAGQEGLASPSWTKDLAWVARWLGVFGVEVDGAAGSWRSSCSKASHSPDGFGDGAGTGLLVQEHAREKEPQSPNSLLGCRRPRTKCIGAARWAGTKLRQPGAGAGEVGVGGVWLRGPQVFSHAHSLWFKKIPVGTPKIKILVVQYRKYVFPKSHGATVWLTGYCLDYGS